MTKISQNQDELFVGVDVSKATLEVALDDKRKTEQFNNDQAGIAALLTQLQSLNVSLVLMEATGGFERSLAQYLCLAGMSVIVVNLSTSRTSWTCSKASKASADPRRPY